MEAFEERDGMAKTGFKPSASWRNVDVSFFLSLSLSWKKRGKNLSEMDRPICVRKMKTKEEILGRTTHWIVVH